MILLFLVATLVAVLVSWPSAATIEAWGDLSNRRFGDYVIYEPEKYI